MHPLVKFNNNNDDDDDDDDDNNNNNITRRSHQKPLEIALDSNLNFNTNIDQKIKRCNKMTGLIRRLSVNLPLNSLLAIYKSFIRPILDYGGILFWKPNNENF